MASATQPLEQGAQTARPVRSTRRQVSWAWLGLVPFFLFSDEGQNIWLKGYCHPIRYENLVETDAVPAEQLAKLPDVEGAVFPSLEQLNAASTLITENWDAEVGLNIE